MSLQGLSKAEEDESEYEKSDDESSEEDAGEDAATEEDESDGSQVEDSDDGWDHKRGGKRRSKKGAVKPRRPQKGRPHSNEPGARALMTKQGGEVFQQQMQHVEVLQRIQDADAVRPPNGCQPRPAEAPVHAAQRMLTLSAQPDKLPCRDAEKEVRACSAAHTSPCAVSAHRCWGGRAAVGCPPGSGSRAARPPVIADRGGSNDRAAVLRGEIKDQGALDSRVQAPFVVVLALACADRPPVCQVAGVPGLAVIA